MSQIKVVVTANGFLYRELEKKAKSCNKKLDKLNKELHKLSVFMENSANTPPLNTSAIPRNTLTELEQLELLDQLSQE